MRLLYVVCGYIEDTEILASPEGGGSWNGRADEEEVSLAETSTNSSSPLLHPSGSASLEDPITCAIVSGKSSTIEIRKGKLGLGIKVIGGSDTVLVSSCQLPSLPQLPHYNCYTGYCNYHNYFGYCSYRHCLIFQSYCHCLVYQNCVLAMNHYQLP